MTGKSGDAVDGAAPSAPVQEEQGRVTSDELRLHGNAVFTEGRFEESIELYTSALACATKEEMPAILANRALALIRFESFERAIEDATKCIELDPVQPKGYYRRGSALLAERKFSESVRDFRKVTELIPRDAQARMKLKIVEKLARQEAFFRALADTRDAEPKRPRLLETATDTTSVSKNYDGPLLESELTNEFVCSAIEWMQQQKVLPRSYVWDFVQRIGLNGNGQSALIRYSIPKGGKLTIVGDIHGQFYDLLNIFKMNGEPSPTNPYLFMGDYVDRGSWGVEVVVTLLMYKILYPEHVILLGGNHELSEINKLFGFRDEAVEKYDSLTFDLFIQCFETLPLAAVVDDRVFCVHGGLPRELPTLDALASFQRSPYDPTGDKQIVNDMLWSDPQPEMGVSPSPRGEGTQFGPDVTKEFLLMNNLEYVVRSHQVKEEGFSREHDGRLITVFSAPKYQDVMHNLGAYMTLKSEGEPDIRQFSGVDHPVGKKRQVPFF